MIRNGKVIQIIKNKDFYDYFGKPELNPMIQSRLDLVVLESPDYPGYLMSVFKRLTGDTVEYVFPILMEATKIKLNDVISVECEPLTIPTQFYMKVKK